MDKKVSKLPWFPMYAGDWFLSTAEMSNAEKGAYIDLLCMQWDNGSILKVPTRYLKEWDTLKDKFVKNGAGRLINLRLDEIRQVKNNALEKQRLGGIESAKVRGEQPTKQPSKQPTATRARNQSQSQSQKLESESEPKKRYNQTAFDQFWAEYPRKVGKLKCREWWKSHKPKNLEQMLTTIKAFKLTEQWQTPKHVPHPLTWLNRGGWDDEVSEGVKATIEDRLRDSK